MGDVSKLAPNPLELLRSLLIRELEALKMLVIGNIKQLDRCSLGPQLEEFEGYPESMRSRRRFVCNIEKIYLKSSATAAAECAMVMLQLKLMYFLYSLSLSQQFPIGLGHGAKIQPGQVINKRHPLALKILLTP